MKKKHAPIERTKAAAAEMTSAIRALSRLDTRVVERCPRADCALCVPALTKAA